MPGGERLYGRGMVTYSVAKRDQTGATKLSTLHNLAIPIPRLFGRNF